MLRLVVVLVLTLRPRASDEGVWVLREAIAAAMEEYD